MRQKSSIVLLLVLNALVFGAIYWLQDNDSFLKRGKDQEVWKSSTFEVNKIEIIAQDSEGPKLLEKRQDRWELTHPIVWPANSHAVQRLLTELQFLKSEVNFTLKEIEGAGQSLADYGFDNPSIKITLSNTLDTKQILVGKPTQLGNRLYVYLPEQERISVVDKAQLMPEYISLESLRDKKIFTLLAQEVNHLLVKVTAPNELKLFLNKKEGDWFFESPIQAEANKFLLSQCLEQLCQIKAVEFLSIHESELTQLMELSLYTAKKEDTLRIYESSDGEEEGFYLGKKEGSEIYFRIPSSTINLMKEAQQHLRERKVLSIDNESAESLTLLQGNRKVALKRLETGVWMLNDFNDGEPKQYRADDQVVAALVQFMGNLEALDFVTDAPTQDELEAYGFYDPQRELVVTSQEVTKTLLLGNLDPKTGNVYAKLKDQTHVFTVDSSMISFTPISSKHFRARHLVEAPEGTEVVSLKITDLINEKVLFDKGSTSISWNELLAKEEGVVAEALQYVCKSWPQLEVNHIIQEAYTPYARKEEEHVLPWMYKLDVELAHPSFGDMGKMTQQLYVSQRLAGSFQIGGIPEVGATFSLTQGWIDHLDVLLKER